MPAPSPAPSARAPASAPPGAQAPTWDALPPPAPAVDEALPASGGVDEAAATVGCRDCGKPLTDPFDQALGICDECRAKADVGGPVRESGGLDLKQVWGRTSTPIAPTLTSVDKPKAPPAAPAVLSAARADAPSEGGAGKWILLAVLIVLAGGGAAAFLFRDKLSRPRAADQANAIPPAIAAILPSWKMANVEVSGTAADHLAQGQKLLTEDRLSSYEQAIEEFQKALILDPRSDAAIAGYIEALAWGRGTRVDAATYEQAMGLASAAEKRSNRAPDVLLARAFLLLLRPQEGSNLEQARAIAEEVLNKTRDARILARAHLVVGRSWLSTSSPLAVESFTRAIDLDPELRSALFQRALANEASGNVSAALADLDKRLQMDPQHWASNAELARIYRDAGRMDLARQVYQRILEKNPDLARARLELAVFRYQAENKTGEALAELRAMARDLDRYDEPDQVEILTHLATAERIAGNENAAVEAAQRALQIAPADPAPHLQLFLVALTRGLTSDAEKSFEALRGKLEDAGLEKLLEGRLRMLENRWSDAVAAFDEAVAADSRRIDARLLAGVAAANANKKDLALARLFGAAKEDPSRPPPPPASSRFYFQPLALVRGAEGQIAKLSTGPEDVLPRLYEGVLRFHLGQPAETARLTAQVTDLDTHNALAHAWHAFALLKQGDAKGARASGERAVAAGRTHALAQYGLGLALAALQKDEEARRALSEALRLEPSLLGAEQKLAEIDARHDEVESARKRLTHVLSLDPAWKPARQLLFSLEKENAGEGARPR